MTTISIEQTQAIADLSRLALTDEERERFREQLASILEYVEALNAVPTDAVEPTAQVTDLVNAVREDAIHPASADERDGILREAPDRSGDGLRVQNVFTSTE